MPTTITGRGVPRPTPLALLTLVGLLALVAACQADAPTGARQNTPDVPIVISAALTPEQIAVIAGMSVEVTGPGIGIPIVAELEVSAAAVNGTVTVPVGGQRTFTVRAFDAAGLETYTGDATATVRPGANPTVTITLYARSGGVPVLVSVGTVAISLDVSSVTIPLGGTASVGAIVRDAGTVVTAGTLRWGSLNPVLVRNTPGASGRTVQLSGLVEGSTTLVATFDGVAVAIPVTVVAPTIP